MKKWEFAELCDHLQTDPGSTIFSRLKHALALRSTEPAFHPDAEQRVVPTDDTLFAFRRTHGES